MALRQPAVGRVRSRAPARAEADVRSVGRLAWIDATRGYSVAAVVLFHVVLWGYQRADVPLAEVGGSLWSFVNTVLGSVRMPVLLAVSGLVLARRIRRGPVRGGILQRSAANYYLYVVWVLVYALFFLLLQQPYLRHRIDGPVELVTQLALPGTTLWYLLAIAIYSVVLTALRRLPPWAVLAPLVVLSSVVHAGSYAADDLWHKIPELFVFYAMGVYAAPLLRRLAEGATALRLALATAAAAAVTVVGWLVPNRVADAVLFVPRGAAFMALAVIGVALAIRWGPVERIGVLLGRQTLAVYVLHPLLIALLTILVLGPGRAVYAALLFNPVSAVLYPAVVTAGIIALSVAVRRLADRAGLRWLFAMPDRWTAALAAEPPTDQHRGAGPTTDVRPVEARPAGARPTEALLTDAGPAEVHPAEVRPAEVPPIQLPSDGRPAARAAASPGRKSL